MSQVRTLLRGIAATTGGTPAEVLRGLDGALETLQVEAMASAVVVRVEQSPEERAAGVTRLRWTNAGHLPPLLVSPEGVVRELHGPAPELVLGITADGARTDTVVEVPRGSTLVLYTDGLVERRGQHLQEGVDALAELVTQLVPEAQARATGRVTLDATYLADAVLARSGTTDEPDDDIALLVVHLGLQDDGPADLR
jgi:serine phosphatase RsbU (regulator of sigma subunit)